MADVGNTMDTIVRNLLKGFYQPPTQGQYTPTMVVGLGGAGVKVVRTLKKCLANYSRQHVKLLAIDSDDGENTHYTKDLPQLDRNELFLMQQDLAINDLASAEASMPKYRYINDFLPIQYGPYRNLHQMVREKIQTRKGAGQFRRAGKALFGSNVNNGVKFNRLLRTAREDLIGLATVLANQIQGVNVNVGTKIFVVSSAAGGTGAGILVDFLALLRTHFNGPVDIITLFLLLPGNALDKMLRNPNDEIPNTRGNAMGLIRELQALKLGTPHEFIFDIITRYKYTGTDPLFHDCYLVGHELYDGTPVTTWMEMCQAVGYFLYGLVGSGVGASQDSGAVNGQIPDDAQVEAIPRIFNTLGVSALEYPVQELGTYGIFHALKKQMDILLNRKVDVDRLKKEANATLDAMGFSDIGGVRAKLNFTVNSLPPRQVKYLPGKEERDLAMKKQDPEFIGLAEVKMNEIDSQLGAHSDDWRQRTNSAINEIRLAIDTRSRHLITGNHALAVRHFEEIKKNVNSIQQALQKDIERRQAAFQQLEMELELLKKKIHFWDFGLDKKFRRQFIEKVNLFLEHKVNFKADGFISTLLLEVEKQVNNMIAAISNIQAAFVNIHQQIANRLNEIQNRSQSLHFIQSALPYSSFEQWVAGLNLPVRFDFEVSRLDEEAILKEAMKDVQQELIRALRNLNIKQDAARNRDVAARVRSLNTSGKPFIQLVPTAPREWQMIPQAFIAADVTGDRDPFVTSNFGGENRRIRGIPIDNPQMALYLATMHGFGIAHWVGYPEALRYYKEKEWYFHTFPGDDHRQLQPLEAMSDDRLENLQIMGLGLMFGLVLKIQNNYYRNMIFSVGDQKHVYLTYRKDPGSYAQKLLDAELIHPARTSQVRPHSEEILGKSLDAAIQAIGDIKWVDFVTHIRDLMFTFIASIGITEAKSLINEYVDGPLMGEIKSIKQSTQRRQILDEIAAALKKYADDIRS